MVITKVSNINNRENTADAFANWSSNPLLPIKVSAPPEIVPERPALLPDCNKTVAITPKAHMICKIKIKVCILL